MCLYTNFETRNVDLEMALNRIGVVEREIEIRKVSKTSLTNKTKYFVEIKL